MPTRRKDDCEVTYPDDQKTRDMVFDMVIEYYFEYKAFRGESIMQMDNPQIYAPVVLSEIADKIGFKVKYDWDKEEGQ